MSISLQSNDPDLTQHKKNLLYPNDILIRCVTLVIVKCDVISLFSKGGEGKITPRVKKQQQTKAELPTGLGIRSYDGHHPAKRV